MLNEIIVFFSLFAISALFMLFFSKCKNFFKLNFNMNIFAPFLFASFFFLFFCIESMSRFVFTKIICYILFILALYHINKYIKLRNIHKVNLYYKHVAEILRSIIYTQCRKKRPPYSFEQKFKYILDRLLYKEYYSLDVDYRKQDYSQFKFQSYSNIQPKFCDVLGLFRDVLRSYENYSDEITYLFDSRPQSTTEEEIEYLEHLLSVTNKMVEEVHELLGTDVQGTDKYYKLTYEDYSKYISWKRRQTENNTTPENQNEVNQ